MGNGAKVDTGAKVGKGVIVDIGSNADIGARVSIGAIVDKGTKVGTGLGSTSRKVSRRSLSSVAGLGGDASDTTRGSM